MPRWASPSASTTPSEDGMKATGLPVIILRVSPEVASVRALDAPPVRVEGIEDAGVRGVAHDVLNAVARDVQQWFDPVPSDLRLEATTCGPDALHLAYWDSNRRTIGLCSELIADLQEAQQIHEELNAERHLYADENQALIKRYQTYQAVQGILFIAYHELGHALVDLYELQIESNEEIAVDGFATWWAIERGTPEIAVQGAITFDQFGLIEHENPFVEYSELHGPSADRYRNIACWLVGAGQDVPDHFREDAEERGAAACREEYDGLARKWTALLSGHLR
jgi:hypothetical protein